MSWNLSNGTASQRLCMVSMVLGFGLMVALFHVIGVCLSSGWVGLEEQMVLSKEFKHHIPRKLLTLNVNDNDGDGDGDGGNGTMNQIGTSTCSKDNIVIFQGPTTPLPNGIPTYTVQIINVCVSGCSVSNIHLSCGWFSSARLINPRLFRRICYDDCLVNNGDALAPGESLSFQYANSFQYPLGVSSVAC